MQLCFGKARHLGHLTSNAYALLNNLFSAVEAFYLIQLSLSSLKEGADATGMILSLTLVLSRRKPLTRMYAHARFNILILITIQTPKSQTRISFTIFTLSLLRDTIRPNPKFIAHFSICVKIH
jgi:hypothetical protein